MKIRLTIVTFCVMLMNSAMAQHVYTIDTTETFQSIHLFGASDAWSKEMNENWNDSVKKILLLTGFSASKLIQMVHAREPDC